MRRNRPPGLGLGTKVSANSLGMVSLTWSSPARVRIEATGTRTTGPPPIEHRPLPLLGEQAERPVPPLPVHVMKLATLDDRSLRPDALPLREGLDGNEHL
jgi:hypothetical protein